VSKFWSQHVHGLHPYVPGEQPKIANLVKLNTNESPYGPSPKVLAVLKQELDQAGESLRLYPDPSSANLVTTVAKYYGLSSDCVFVGNGSDEVLAHAFNAFFCNGKPLLFPDISYSFYPVYCGLFNIEYRAVPLLDDFSIAVSDYDGDIGGVILPNPNAPTAMLLALSEIEILLKNNADNVVIIDEAYVDFGGESAASLIGRFDNLLIVQTLSKSRALAGMRVGLALGQPHLIEGLVRIKDSFNSYPINRLSQLAAIAAFEDEDYFQMTCRAVIESREWLAQQLIDRGFNVLPSAANFVFASHGSKKAIDLTAGLRDRGVIVRHFNKSRIDNFLRITIGTPQQNKTLLAALDAMGIRA
jgi:histidinol-phosphate aminotransferase